MRDHKAHPSREAYEAVLVDDLRARGVQLVCLAGFMRLLGATFVDAFPNRILNIHPALLPAFPGLHAQRQAMEHGVKVSGATVHFVDTNLDAGPIVLQAAVPVLDADTEDTLSARILEQEHRIYPEAIQRILDGGWRIEGRRVVFERRVAARGRCVANRSTRRPLAAGPRGLDRRPASSRLSWLQPVPECARRDALAGSASRVPLPSPGLPEPRVCVRSGIVVPWSSDDDVHRAFEELQWRGLVYRVHRGPSRGAGEGEADAATSASIRPPPACTSARCCP